MSARLDRHADHVLKRNTAIKRWMLVILDLVTIAGALATAAAADSLHLAATAVAFDFFLDPVTVAAGYGVWLKEVTT